MGCPPARWLPLACLLLAACAGGAADSGAGSGAGEDPGAQLLGHWELVEIRSMDDRVFRPAEDARFALSLLEGGGLTLLAHCNRGLGSWLSEGPGQLRFGPLATTRAYCGADSLHDRYLADLAAVRSYVLRDGRLYLATMADGAILEFRPVEAE